MNTEFKATMAWWKSDSAQMWEESVRFFSEGHHFLNEWRNDVGGHFHDAAATYAIANVHRATVGAIEVYRRGTGMDIRMPFAYELVAVAMTKNKKVGQQEREFLKKAFQFLVGASTAAIQAVQVVVRELVFPRF